MESFIYIPLAILVVIALFIAMRIAFKRDDSQGGRKKKKKKVKAKDRQTILKEAGKRLAQNPKDPRAIQMLADLHYREQTFEDAFKQYQLLIELCATNPHLDEFTVTMRHALSAMQLKKFDVAYRSLMIARTLKDDNFEINYNLGYLEFMRKNFQKAVPYLQKARLLEPEHSQINRFLGHSFFHLKKFDDAASALRRSLDNTPDDKESLYILAQTYFHLSQNDLSLKIFNHLRTDPNIGARASLFSGTIQMKNKNYDKAIEDFEIGLRHENTQIEILLELKYRLAAANLVQNDIGQAIHLWKEIKEFNPKYKDVQDQLNKYQEINTNRNLQLYLMSSNSEFVTLCRKLTTSYFSRANTKILNIALPGSEYVDLFAEVYTRQWEDMILFRFIRSNGQAGELIMREMYSRIKELKAGRGICITAGDFSEGARVFVEARLIDLVEKEELLKLFARLPSRPMAPPAVS
jgi:tetratricopeptide (TPR) repeat protein